MNMKTIEVVSTLYRSQLRKADEVEKSINDIKRKIENPEISHTLFEKLCSELEFLEFKRTEQLTIARGISMTHEVLFEELKKQKEEQK